MTKRKFRGSVKWFNNEKGFGFITDIVPIEVEIDSNETTVSEQYNNKDKEWQQWDKEDIFCYYASILDDCRENKFKTLKEKEQVEFVIREVKEGRPQAVDIIVIKDTNIS